MSLFDEIRCDMPLPGDVPDFLKKRPDFQTYDLGKGMNEYVITETGQIHLVRTAVIGALLGLSWCEDFQEEPTPIMWKRKKIHMYASNIRGGSPSENGWISYTADGSDCIDIGYDVQIRNGKVSSIKEVHRIVKPAQKENIV